MISMVYSLSLESKFPDCVRHACKEDECKLKLNGFPGKRVILSMDCMMKSADAGKRCDYAVVADEQNDTFLLPVEFKSKILDPAKIKEQLEGGIRFLRKHLPRQFKCYPVLVSKKLDRQTGKKLREIRVRYCQGRETTVKHVPCNQPLRWSKVKK